MDSSEECKADINKSPETKKQNATSIFDGQNEDITDVGKNKLTPEPLKNASSSVTSTPQGEITGKTTNATSSGVKSPHEPSCFPVPMSFIERCQNQLLSSILSSPIVAVKNAEVLSPSSSCTETENPRFAFKICDRCPHCIAMATEITRLLSISNKADRMSPDLKPEDRPINPIHQPMLDVSNISAKLKGMQRMLKDRIVSKTMCFL